MSTVYDITEGAAIKSFCLLAKPQKGKALVAVIQQALSAPNIYVFGELLDMPNVQQLIGTDDQKSVDLLKIFAFGTYADYKANAANLPVLNALALTKLKQLTIVTLAARQKVIPYSTLLAELEVGNLRELEDLIIECLYQGLVSGKLDQKAKQLEVDTSMGRDLKPGQLDTITQTLQLWSQKSSSLLKVIEEKINYANWVHEENRKAKAEFDQKIDNIKQNIKAALEADGGAGDFDGGDFFDDRGRKSRQKMKAPHGGPGPQHRGGRF